MQAVNIAALSVQVSKVETMGPEYGLLTLGSLLHLPTSRISTFKGPKKGLRVHIRQGAHTSKLGMYERQPAFHTDAHPGILFVLQYRGLQDYVYSYLESLEVSTVQ